MTFLCTRARAQLAELTKLSAESRDNVKFLTTLERHFKNVTSGPLQGILDTLPPMMNALRMVWIISRHYSDDQRMGNLFQRIAREIGDRVESAVDMRQLFRMQPQDAVELVRTCKSVLEHWYMTYMQVRRSLAPRCSSCSGTVRVGVGGKGGGAGGATAC